MVEIKLKEDAHDLASEWRLESIIKRHSNYVSFPIYVKGEQANQQTAPWRKPMKEVTPEEYDEFYRQLTFDMQAPLLHVHIITDAPVDIRSILYVPARLDRTAWTCAPITGCASTRRRSSSRSTTRTCCPNTSASWRAWWTRRICR